MKFWLAGFAGEQLLNTLLGTVRFRVMTAAPPTGKPVIFTLWHGRLLPLTYFHRNQQITTLISRSGDGEYIARVVERWGYATARGSSSRGGSSGLREMIQAARHGSSLAITPDGPRGPRQKLKPGVLNAAQLTGLPLVPMSGAATKAWWVEGWDRFLIPKPFSTMYVRYAEPIHIPRAATAADLLVFEREVEQTLNDLTEQADADAHA
jgi:lysophospholipid acyltransferase (LPLAT)-like uncharacterized protein